MSMFGDQVWGGSGEVWRGLACICGHLAVTKHMRKERNEKLAICPSTVDAGQPGPAVGTGLYFGLSDHITVRYNSKQRLSTRDIHHRTDAYERENEILLFAVILGLNDP